MTIVIPRLEVPMRRSVGSRMIKNEPTVNGRAVFLGLLTIALVIVAPIGHGWAQGAEPELITFTSGDIALKGFIWKPEGLGPFPAIVWNHGSERLPGTVNSVAPYFVSRGYIFLVPHRRGQGSFLRRHSDNVGGRTQIRLSRCRQLFRCRSDLEGVTGFARPSDGRRQQGNDTGFLSSGRERLRSNAQPRLE